MPLVVRRNRMCGIVNENEISSFADFEEGVHVTGDARNMHREDCFRTRREFLGDFVHVNVERRRIDVNKKPALHRYNRWLPRSP